MIYGRIFNYYSSSSPENPIIYLPWVIFLTGLLSINAGIAINGLSRFILQIIYVMSNCKDPRKEIKSVTSSIWRSLRILKKIQAISERNDENYLKTFKRVVGEGINSIDENGFTKKEEIESVVERDPIVDKRLVSSHLPFIISYLMVMTATMSIIWYDFNNSYSYMLDFASLLLFLSSPIGVISGIFKDSDYVSYVSYEWNSEPLSIYYYTSFLLFYSFL
ncbi:hypothetical protein [Natrinema sp. SYSU A 869]|uniref:hypothetical protein n=1 Tax=Natrinema sp. SYSU A 869 TaxID=2871694 RepID=UPI001CA3B41E|nr:hypothetical protein [Natrinema sp. SYSU A 869]